jgi:hypothetical protein
MMDDEFLTAAFAAAGQGGWRTLRASRLLDAAFARADRALTEGGAGTDQNLRDRLFDLTMRHLETLAPLRPGLKALIDPRRGDASAGLAVAPILRRSIRALLTAAGVSPDGPTGALRGLGMTAVYLAAFRVFVDDAGEDLGATMAEVDRRLTQIEPWAGRLEKRDCPSSGHFVQCKKDR